MNSSINPIYPELYDHNLNIRVNSNDDKIYTKRMAGKFRRIKWWTASLWLFFFFGPYLRWNEQQAILLDIPARKFHFFSLTIYPQDVWLLSFILLFFAMLLILVTLIAGRVFCGYFCFQTVWTDYYAWIEEKLEGSPLNRQRLDQSPLSAKKLVIKTTKHSLWLLIALLTGISFAAWFTDAFQLWKDYLSFQAHLSAWIVLGLFTLGTYLFAGFMKEQVCCWLCPYSRIQGALSESNTIFPSYDFVRGEPRSNRKSTQAIKNSAPALTENKAGDCIDCDLCVAVCPTGVDIRQGQQIGCITCGLCIDACDHVMQKIERPLGLIRYSTEEGIISGKEKPWYRNPWVSISAMIIVLACSIVIYGIQTLAEFSMSISHNRQPEYVVLSTGKIRNRYQLKLQNKSNRADRYFLSIEGLSSATAPELSQQIFQIQAGQGTMLRFTVDIPRNELHQRINPVVFKLNNSALNQLEFPSVFIGPHP